MKKEELKRVAESILAENVSEIASFITNLIEKKNKEERLPLSIFTNSKLTVLETVVLYLNKNKSLRLCDIANVLQRDEKSLWHTLNKAKKKCNEIKFKETSYEVKLSIFTKEISPLKSLVVYCREELNMRNFEIAKILNRDPRTISSAYSLAKRGDKK